MHARCWGPPHLAQDEFGVNCPPVLMGWCHLWGRKEPEKGCFQVGRDRHCWSTPEPSTARQDGGTVPRCLADKSLWIAAWAQRKKNSNPSSPVLRFPSKPSDLEMEYYFKLHLKKKKPESVKWRSVVQCGARPPCCESAKDLASMQQPPSLLFPLPGMAASSLPWPLPHWAWEQPVCRWH